MSEAAVEDAHDAGAECGSGLTVVWPATLRLSWKVRASGLAKTAAEDPLVDASERRRLRP